MLLEELVLGYQEIMNLLENIINKSIIYLIMERLENLVINVMMMNNLMLFLKQWIVILNQIGEEKVLELQL